MPDRIYFINDDGKLHSMAEQPYANEDIFQELLEQYPGLLSGDQGDGDGVAWLLVTREMAIGDAMDSSGRWSLDHLFLDRQGIPTLVEVKRSSDTRLRREVVGQMLDYAANAVLYWPASRIRERWTQQYVSKGLDPNMALCEFLEAEDEDAVERFWDTVKTNLEAERVRLIFVADDIPAELQRIVEFLNGQMDPAEVIAVELKQFATDSLRTLVPRVIGKTSRAERRKPARKTRKNPWTREELLAHLQQAAPDVAGLAEDLIAWGESKGEVRWGKGAKVGYCYLLNVDHSGEIYAPIAVRSNGQVELSVWGVRNDPALRDALLQWISRLNQIPGMDLAPLENLHYCLRDLKLMSDPQSLALLKQSCEELVCAIDKLPTN